MQNFSKSKFIQRRSKLKELLLPSSTLIISAKRRYPRSRDQFYKYRQSSDFYFLTGMNHPGLTLVVYSGPSSPTSEIIFMEEVDEKTERWEGVGISSNELSGISGVTDIRPHSEMAAFLREALANSHYIYFGQPKYINNSVLPGNEFEIRQMLRGMLDHIQEHDLQPSMAHLRSVKDQSELEMLKKAISISKDAFLAVLKQVRGGLFEYELEAILSLEFRKMGVGSHAFDPIIAAGRNALTLHYIENSSTLKEGDLLLMDFGAEWSNYAADISRTIPINGRFSVRQRQLYDSCLHVLNRSMSLFKPGIRIAEIHEQVGEFWEEEHIKLGLYSRADSIKASREKPLWKEYYWHNTSHSIGLDVHDPFDTDKPIQAGMVLSCEPGLYIREEGVGIRLENDLLITDDAPVNLSIDIPIDADELEELQNT